jgi:4-amino-4-deoxy-L-arabinose transferase-like glycosyltransferase
MKRLLSFCRSSYPALLFLLAFLPRAIQPVSRPLVWYLRSAHFIEAVLARDWANTVYSEHPGVGLMWPVGAALKLYWGLSGISPAAQTVPPDFEPIHFFGPVPLAEIAAGVVPLALLISLGIVGAYFLLRRLFGEAVAATAAILLALSPYFLTQSKVLHLDGWMSTLMLLSALTLLLYRREHRTGWLVLSGALGGLASLVKTPAIFLFPFCGLVLLAGLVRDVVGCAHPPRRVTRGLASAGAALLLWLLVAVLIYVVLWPVMWTEPGRGLAAVAWGLSRHGGMAHDTPTFFLGRITRADPGPLFYGVTLLFRMGEVELVLLVAAAVLGAAHSIRSRRLSETGVDYLLLLGYALFFLVQMCLAPKKMPRYVLPSLLVLDVVAAAGIVAWARGLAGGRKRLALGLMVVPLLSHAALVLPHHPHYGMSFNWLAGGPPAAARALLTGEEGEGLAELAAALNARDEAGRLTVAAQLRHVFNQTFRGTTVDIDEPADYVVFHRNYTVRDYKVGQWGDLWERYAPRTPEMEVGFGGLAYAWLYPALPADVPPEHRLPVRLGGGFQFLGYDLRLSEAAPGDRVPFVLYWQAEAPRADDLSVFVQLLDPDGRPAWLEEGAAFHGSRPTSGWAAGEVIVDPHTVTIPEDLPSGDYLLIAGIYDPRTGNRLPAVTPAGERLAQDRVTISTVTVRRPPIPPPTWIAWGLAAPVLVSTAWVARRRHV